MRRCRFWLLAGLLAALTGCGGGPDQGARTISRETFIEANVALRQVDPGAEDADRRRAEVLEEHGVTADALRAFVEIRSQTTGELAEIWEEIGERLREQQADTISPATETSAI